ncbi:MAG: chlorophyll synthase ChlG [Pseudomonadota bacterium]
MSDILVKQGSPRAPVTPVVGEHRTYPSVSASLELLKPITWFAPMWAFLCGAVSSGAGFGAHWVFVAVGIILAGPLVCGMSQAVNDWFDRHVDALNEPNRPIPSGRIPGRWGLYIAIFWTGVSLAVAATLGSWVFGATLIASALAWAYSAPPFRLKENGWWGNAACGLCYEGLAWFTGAAALLGALPNGQIIALAVLYSIGAHGIMTLNDFKAIDGDRQMGVRSLPVQLGIHNAARLASLVMALPQVVVIALLWSLGLGFYAWLVAAVLLVQLGLMAHYLLNRESLEQNPWRNAALYNATGTTAYVIGMMVAAFGLRFLATGGAI